MDSVHYSNLWFIPRNSQFSLPGLKGNAFNFHQQEDILEKFWAHFSLAVAQVSSYTPAGLQAVVYIKKKLGSDSESPTHTPKLM